MSNKNSLKQIVVARDYARTPGPRFESQGPYSGERFRDTLLVNALNSAERVYVDLDGTSGYGSSFLDEAFGGLVRLKIIAADELLKRLDIKSIDDPAHIEDIRDSILRQAGKK